MRLFFHSCSASPSVTLRRNWAVKDANGWILFQFSLPPGRFGQLLPSSGTGLKTTTMDKKRLIQAIAVIALEVFPDAKWIAQDGDGRWYAYDVKPSNESGYEWLETSQTGDIMFVIELVQPDACAEELYSIDEILNNAN